MRSSYRPLVLLLDVLLVVGLLGGCSMNPATGKRQLSMVGEQQEIAIGRDADLSVSQQYGVYEDEPLQTYLQGLGDQLAKVSERPELPWKFVVVDDPIVNAFALPGGFIYVSRGMLAHMASEAELIGVLGHEVGHVTARHSVEQMSRAQLAGLGLGVAQIASREMRRWGGLANTGLQLAFLKFGRDDERQADSLGLRYLVRTGYDPNQMPKVFHTLDRVSNSSGTGRIPTWQSTHPDPGARSESLRQAVLQLPSDQRAGRVGHDTFISYLDGMTFGKNPREGFEIGNTFYHPELEFRLVFPSGWRIINQRSLVGAISPEKDAMVVLSLTGEGPGESAQAFRNLPGIQAESVQNADTFRFATIAQNPNEQVLHGYARFLEHQGVTFRLLGYTLDSRWGAYQSELGASLAAFSRLEDRRYLQVEPKRIELVKLPQAMSLSDFAKRYPSSVDHTTLAIINGVTAEDVLDSGHLMKRVVGGELPRP